MFFRRVFLVLTILVAACSDPKSVSQIYGTDIAGADFANTFTLKDHTGQLRQLTDFKGKVVALFFGYTHCPDVCPTTMADMANAMKLLGDKANQVQVLFVTLDPARDTQEVLAKYVPSFDSRFIGLYGTDAQTQEVAKNFKIFYQKQVEAGKSEYTIDHSAGTYVFDKEGKIRIYMKYGQKPKEIANDFSLLM